MKTEGHTGDRRGLTPTLDRVVRVGVGRELPCPVAHREGVHRDTGT